jgi:alpha-glucosidase (family GH31 glycosyl hydrolase)
LNDWKTIVEGNGENKAIETSWNHTIVHMREGSIIPYQVIDYKTIKTTKDLIDRPISIIIFPNTKGFAEGFLYIDKDGDNRLDFQSKNYEYYQMRFKNGILTNIKVEGEKAKGIDTGNKIIQEFIILGASEYNNQKIGGRERGAWIFNQINLDFTYKSTFNFENLQSKFDDFSPTWIPKKV